MANRTRIFIDFWNFQLSLNTASNPAYRIDWKVISPWIMKEASSLVGQDLQYEGTNLYISCNSQNDNDKKLRDFSRNFLDYLPGFSVELIERQSRDAPICQNCHKEIVKCVHCGKELKRTIEKGVDTWIVTDIFRFFWEGSLDVAILVSSDRDFIPMVETLSRKGYKVINGHFQPKGMNLASACWASFDFKKGLNSFQKKTIDPTPAAPR
jgi:uncharacterized LabA/DUF88 family protein